MKVNDKVVSHIGIIFKVTAKWFEGKLLSKDDLFLAVVAGYTDILDMNFPGRSGELRKKELPVGKIVVITDSDLYKPYPEYKGEYMGEWVR